MDITSAYIESIIIKPSNEMTLDEKELLNKLTEECKKYFNDNKPIHIGEFIEWNAADDDTIIITYGYDIPLNEVDSTKEYDFITVPISKLLKD